MALVFIVLWIGLFFCLLKKKRELIFNPIAWLFFGWGFIFGLYCFSGIDYKYKLSLGAGLYFWGIALCALLGFFLSGKLCSAFARNADHGICRTAARLGARWPRVSALDPYMSRLCVALSCLGCVMYAVDILRLNTMSFRLHEQINISGIGNVGILLTGMGLIVWLHECMQAMLKQKMLRSTAFLGLISYLVPALMTSGRQNILILGISTFIVLLYCWSRAGMYKYARKLLIPLIVVGAALLGYVTLISARRANVSDKVALFNSMYASTLSDGTAKLLDALGPFKAFVLEVLYYYSHEMSMFQVLFSGYSGPHYWGLSQLTLLARNLPAGDGGTVFDQMWTHYDAMSAEAGVYSHVWRSAAGNCFVDYGVVGGLIFALLCGLALGALYRRVRRTGGIYGMVGMILACTGMLFAMQFSPICEAYWLYPLFWWLVLPFGERILAALERYVPERFRRRMTGKGTQGE